MSLSDKAPDHLRRLPRTYYLGRSWVHWTMTTRNRSVAWLTSEMHLQVRELLVHVSARHALSCPAYCLMPDHAHFLWMGQGEGCDQLNAVKFFRKEWSRLLSAVGHGLQKAAYDHVLDDPERDRTAFEDTCLYIMHNPQRAGLVPDWREWDALGSVIAGYPDLDPRDLGTFWPTLWKIHNRITSGR